MASSISETEPDPAAWEPLGTVTEARDRLGYAEGSEVFDAAADGVLTLWRPSTEVPWTVYRKAGA